MTEMSASAGTIKKSENHVLCSEIWNTVQLIPALLILEAKQEQEQTGSSKFKGHVDRITVVQEHMTCLEQQIACVVMTAYKES